MPTVNLTRTLIADIKNQRSNDYLEVADIDPDEKNRTKLARLLGQALQVTMTLKVLELSEPSTELVTLVAHALNRPHCRLETLVLKGLQKTGLAEISQALGHFSVRDVTMQMTGIAGTSYQTLIISLSAAPFVVMQLTRAQIHQFASLGLPNLTAPTPGTLPEATLAAIPNLAPRQPVVRDHFLSVSSRWASGHLSSSKGHCPPETPFSAERFANNPRALKSNSAFTIPWNPWASPALHAMQLPLLNIPDSEQDYLRLPSLPLSDSPASWLRNYVSPRAPFATVSPRPRNDSSMRPVHAFQPNAMVNQPVSSTASAFTLSSNSDLMPITPMASRVSKTCIEFSK